MAMMYGLASINSNPPAPGLKNILYINKQRATDCIKAEKHRACSVIFINHARFSYMTRDFLCPSLPSPPRTAPPRPLFKQTRITARCINVVKVQPRNKLERAVNTGIFLFFFFFETRRTEATRYTPDKLTPPSSRLKAKEQARYCICLKSGEIQRYFATTRS